MRKPMRQGHFGQLDARRKKRKGEVGGARDGEKERDVKKRETGKRVEKEKEEREGFREPNGNQAMVKGRKPSSGGEDSVRRQTNDRPAQRWRPHQRERGVRTPRSLALPQYQWL